MRRNLSIRQKLYAGFGTVLLLLLAIFGMNVYYNSKTANIYDNLINDQVVTVGLVKDLRTFVEQGRSNFVSYMLTGDQKHLDAYNTSNLLYAMTLEKLEPLVSEGDVWQILQGLDLMHEQFTVVASQTLSSIQNKDDPQTYIKTFTGQSALLDQFSPIAESLVKLEQEALAEEVQHADEAYQASRNLAIAIMVLGLVIGIAVSLIISRALANPIVRLRMAATRIAAGDLSEPQLEISSRDEIGELTEAFNTMTGNLRGLLLEVGLHAEQVAASSEELTAGAEQTGSASEHIAKITEELAEGAGKQSETIQSGLLKVQGIDEEASKVANTAREVSDSVQKATGTVSEGTTAIAKAIGQMDLIRSAVSDISQAARSLNERSEEIGKIISFITDIASQTNLLALNAAIEAARAGEAGRGFAVVAGEVRKLAEQTGQSGKQVSEVIRAIQSDTERTLEKVSASVTAVREGTSTVAAAGCSFEQIQTDFTEVAERIRQVSLAASNMSMGTNHLVQAFEDITRVTDSLSDGTHGVSSSAQQQLATMEEITGAASSLAGMSEELLKLTGRFKLNA